MITYDILEGINAQIEVQSLSKDKRLCHVTIELYTICSKRGIFWLIKHIPINIIEENIGKLTCLIDRHWTNNLPHIEHKIGLNHLL
jgi:hypothetical protein